jgi:RNA polymerase sigma-70 factor, ECF subfamily
MSHLRTTRDNLKGLVSMDQSDSKFGLNFTALKTVEADRKENGHLPPLSEYSSHDLPENAADEVLLERYRNGDRESFRALVERYQRELFHFLLRFTGNRAAAEDVFQETFLQVHQSAADFDVRRRFRPWLFTIAANKARDLMRSRQRHPSTPLQASISPGGDESAQFIDFMMATGELPEESMERQELARRVRATVMELPVNLREILLLSYFNQFPYAQISDMLGIPLGTVKSRLHSAVAEFAIRWKSLNKSGRAS